MNVNKKRLLEVLEVARELRKDKIAVLKKAIKEGIYHVKADYIAETILREVLFELALNLNNHRERGHKTNSIYGNVQNFIKEPFSFRKNKLFVQAKIIYQGNIR